jgi:hypothetical protein
MTTARVSTALLAALDDADDIEIVGSLSGMPPTLRTGPVYSDGGIEPGTPDLIRGGVFVISERAWRLSSTTAAAHVTGAMTSGRRPQEGRQR